MPLQVRLIALGLFIAFVLPACGGDGDAPRTMVTVFAASSLTEAFEDAAAVFEKENEGIDVQFNFAGSPALRTQLDQGAPADAYAAADEENMRAAADAGLVEAQAQVFARNALAIIVPRENPGNVHLLPDLAKTSLRIVVAAPEVPVGRYTREVLDKIAADDGFVPGFRESVLANIVSEEPNVKAVVAKVQLGEADAGIVYASDVTEELEDELTIVEIPLDFNIVAAYPVAVTVNAGEPEGARAFIDFLLSQGGQDILEEHGFMRAS